MAVMNLIKFAVWPTLPGRQLHCIMQKWCALEKGPWSYAHMKSCFLSSRQYMYSWCGAPAFLAT